MITGDKFIKYAKRLVSNNSISEEEARSAISRAYYSLYHQTLAVTLRSFSLILIKKIEKNRRKRLKRYERIQLNSMDPRFLQKCNFHRILPDTLFEINPVLSFSFKNFRDQRNQADYDLKLTFTHGDADTIVNSIDVVLNQITSL